MKKRKIILLIIASLLAIGTLTWVWNKFLSPTRIAFINYQVITLGEIAKANDNPFICIEELSVNEIEDKIDDYDMVFVNAMGIRLTVEQRDVLEIAGLTGTPILTTSATNPANRIVSIEETEADTIACYLGAGLRTNYRSMLNYVRTHIDKKAIFKGDVNAVVERKTSMFTHRDIDNPEDEEVGFDYLSQYIDYLKRHNLYTEGAQSIIITGAMGIPYDLCASLEEHKINVFIVAQINPVSNRDMLDSIAPSAIVNFAHGRMGDAMVDYLSERNTPLFCPLNTNRLTDDWLNDKQGMSGGFMSQSLVTPEIDGALRPFALFAQRINNEGLHEAYTMPDRLCTFVETIENYIKLKQKSNAEKRIVIVYFGSAENNIVAASGLEGKPSLYNLMLRLKKEGYTVDLPESSGKLDLKRREWGNIALVQQPMAGEGVDTFAIVHGTGSEPTAAFKEAYRWIHEDFKADALIHFGTHGGLEYTPSKQVALSSNDWPDRLIGPLPHFYIYTIGNVGEALIAKRRTYAGIQSHLTAPFMESELHGLYRNLTEAIKSYNNDNSDKTSMKVKQIAMQMGIERELKLDTAENAIWSSDEIARLEEFAEELTNAKITGQLYTLGEPYENIRIESSVMAMAADPIAYSLLSLDRQRGCAPTNIDKHKTLFTQQYLIPAKRLADDILQGKTKISDDLICHVANINKMQLSKAREIEAEKNRPTDMMSMMARMAQMKSQENNAMPSTSDSATSSKPDSTAIAKMKEAGKNIDPREALKMAKSMGAPPAALKKMAEAMGITSSTATKQEADGISKMMKMMADGQKKFSKEEYEESDAIMEVVRTIENITNYQNALTNAPEEEMASMMNALNGGFTRPSTGGDVVSNPRTLPTGRNLYGINAEATPSASAWEKGKQLADRTIEMYRRSHHDSIPRKVSYTLWSSEFIETEGASIAQILYMLGVEPVRDAFGRVADIRLIPSEELGRERIDIVVQTSGQLRDLAASRLYLISKAVSMAAEAKDDKYPNLVSEGILESEKSLTLQGISPKEAREMSTFRVFGGIDGNYGTGIQGMVQNTDGGNNPSNIADTYLNNMGAFYGSAEEWERHSKAAFKAAITRTDAIVQPRQSNTWGALSLDHVYEFMGGINLAVEHVTGKQPEAYFADYRNRNNNRMQELKEAIGIESRTTIFNPTYLREKIKGGANEVAALTEIVDNSFGWSVTRKGTIDKEMWQQYYEVLVSDKFDLGLDQFMLKKNPTATGEMAHTMLKAADMGYWNATNEQRNAIEQISKKAQEIQRSNISNNSDANESNGIVMKKETLSDMAEQTTTLVSAAVVAAIVLTAMALLIVVIRRRRKMNE